MGQPTGEILSHLSGAGVARNDLLGDALRVQLLRLIKSGDATFRRLRCVLLERGQYLIGLCTPLVLISMQPEAGDCPQSLQPGRKKLSLRDLIDCLVMMENGGGLLRAAPS